MPDIGMANFATGFIEGRQASQQFQQNKLLMALTTEEIQEKAIDIQQKDVKLKEAKMLLEKQNALNNILKGQAAGGQQDPLKAATNFANIIRNIAAAEMQAGLPEAAAEHIKQAADIEKNQAETTRIAAQVTRSRRQNEASLVDAALQGGPQAWDDIRFKLSNDPEYAQEAKDPFFQKFINSPYDPKMLNQLRTALTTEIERATIAEKNSAEIRNIAVAKLDDENRAQIPERMRIMRERLENSKKAGNSYVKSTQINEVASLAITSLNLDPTSAEAYKVKALSVEVAEKAVDYMKKDKIPWSAARKKAVDEAIHSDTGPYRGIRPGRPLMGSYQRPRALPANQQDLYRPENMNQWYKGYDGKVARWDGKSWSTAPDDSITVAPDAGGIEDEDKE